MASISITPRDRLSFTLFLAVSLHAAAILGISFSAKVNQATSPTIEVTLAQYSDLEAPDDADFIAQANQQGSGTEAEVLETTAEQETDFHANRLEEIAPDPLARSEAIDFRQRALLTTQSTAEDEVTARDQLPEEEVISPLDARNLSYDELAHEIASLEARIAQEQQAQAKAPRVKRLTSVSTKTATEAAYLNAWRQKVERIGNANYPAGGAHGDLRLLVVLSYDGALKEVRVLDSSGAKALDDAALRIVRLAAPYPDFPVEMRKQYDQLEIIRTWQFSRAGNRLGS
jgi:protein TonB